MDTNCSFNREKLSAYLDNELSGEELSEVKKHISECGECSKFLSLLQENDLGFENCIKTELPSSFLEKFNLNLGMKLASQTKKHSSRRFLLPIAASFLCVFALYYFTALQGTKPGTFSAITTESTASKHIFKKIESALISVANLNENDSEELLILQKALLDSNLIEKIRELRLKTKDKELHKYLVKLEGVLTLMQNEYSPVELCILKGIINEKGLIEESRFRQSSLKEELL